MNGDIDDEYYEEGIYVGYRYFDSFNVTPAYPFGYGLSYTSFEIRTEKVSADGGQVKINVQVKNTGGRFAGREVVQAYYSAPEGILEKPYQELAAYGKTGTLLPGESEYLELSFPIERMASYDEERACWVMEKGTYYIRVGSSCQQRVRRLMAMRRKKPRRRRRCISRYRQRIFPAARLFTGVKILLWRGRKARVRSPWMT